ncbi:prepilin-type N-terminal cleavage/methylation domain-containing protein [Candidatus Sumerlaeota bacterium]|nr:prepilin-type N-terminal cleavage/methylation domain-containing protein [Candidatus Sumerlaeota bacterium]
MNKKGFTLIELLIVVAIIGILAAIAIPNFLNASIRSKVARTKSDLRTISTALESYYVDHNKYPPDAQCGVINYLERLKHLTTPIAYITSVLEDPFANAGNITSYFSSRPENPYAIPPDSSGKLVRPFTYDFACRRLPDGGYESPLTWIHITRYPYSVIWAMRGIGPDKIPTVLGDGVARPYDPTNGTVSFGDIFWSGPGVGEDYPLAL